MENLYIVLLIMVIVLISVLSYSLYTINKRNNIRYNIERLKFTREFMKDIDSTIVSETIRKIKYATMLDQKLIPRDFDEFIEEICKNVYEAYEKKIYTNKNILYDHAYIFKYIHNKSVMIYSEYLMDSSIGGNTEE